MNEAILQCPKCKETKNVIRVVYGWPSDEMEKQAEKGEILLGGCMKINIKYFCKNCQLKY